MPPQQLRKKGILAVRWQNFHREITETRPRLPVDKFIFKEFAAYLEGAGMAFRERLTLADLKKAGKLLKAIQGDKGRPALKSFRTLDACGELIEGVCLDIRQEFPGFEEWRRWGPAYYPWPDTDDEICGLSIAFSFWRGNGRLKQEIGCSISFPNDSRESICWTVFRLLKGELQPIDAPIRHFFTAHYLDRDKLLRQFRTQVRRWGHRALA